MGRIVIVLAVASMMSGCAILTTVSGVAGAAFDGLFYMFQGSERSISISMRSTLVAVQRGLNKSGLNVNVLEPVKDGYMIEFGNDNLDGSIELEKQTDSLTTVTVKVKSGAMSMRQDSVEQAILETIEEQSKKVGGSDRFDFNGYDRIYKEPEESSPKIGWFLPGTLLNVSKIYNNPEWLNIKMPSGKQGYLKGDVAAPAHK